MKPQTLKIVLGVVVSAVVLGAMYLIFTSQNNNLNSGNNQVAEVLENTGEYRLESLKLNKIEGSGTSDTLPDIDGNENGETLEIKTYPEYGEFVVFPKIVDGKMTVYTRAEPVIYDLISEESDDFTGTTELKRDGTTIWSKKLTFLTFDPVINFFATGNKVVIGYDHFPDFPVDTDEEADVVVDAQSMNTKLGLDRSFAAYPLKDKIVFLGMKSDRYYLVIDEKKYELSSEITEIFNPHCCEPAMFAIDADGSSMLFYSKNKDGYWYVNKITIN